MRNDLSTDPRQLLDSLRLTITLTTVLDPVPSKRSTVVDPLNEVRDACSRLRFLWPVGPRAKLLEEAGHVTFLEKLHKHNSELLQTVAEQAGKLSRILAKPASKKTTLRDVNKDLAKLWQMLEASFHLAADGSDDIPVDQLVAACTALEGRAALLLHPPDVWAFWATDFHGSPTGMAVLEHLVSAITSRWNPFPKALSVLEGYGGTLPEAKASVIRTTLFLRPDLTKPAPATPTAKGRARPGSGDERSRSLEALAKRVSREAERGLEREGYVRSLALKTKAELYLTVQQELTEDAPDQFELDDSIRKLKPKTELTALDEEFISLILQGMDNLEIAQELGISHGAARGRRCRVLKKLRAVG